MSVQAQVPKTLEIKCGGNSQGPATESRGVYDLARDMVMSNGEEMTPAQFCVQAGYHKGAQKRWKTVFTITSCQVGDALLLSQNRAFGPAIWLSDVC